MFKLTQIKPDPYLAHEDAWEAFDPGFKSLYTGHLGTSMSRSQWREVSGATWFAKKVIIFYLFFSISQIQNENLQIQIHERKIKVERDAIATASLKSARWGILLYRISHVWLPHWGKLWKHYTGTRKK